MAQPVVPNADSHMHIVKTTAQWNDRSIANWIVPRGCLCIELTPDYKTKLKVGEGDKYYIQLPYIGGDGGDLSNYYTKQEIDNILKNLDYMSIKSINEYPSPDTLPTTGNKQGDVRFVKNTSGGDPLTYLWNGLKWISVTGLVDIDLSEYAKKSEVNPRLQALEQQAHTHQNKSVVDQLTQPVIDNSHKHTNSDVLDQLTQDVIDDSHGHDNQDVLDQLTQPVIDYAHKHSNRSILDQTTAPYTIDEKLKLASLKNYTPFVGTDGTLDGQEGLVPKPTTSDADKYLASDGTWKTVAAGEIPIASETRLGGIKVGDGLSIDENGVLEVDNAPTPGGTSYVAGDGISIDEGSTTTDITNINWEQGDINHTTGQDDDTHDYCIRSPFLDAGLTNMINVSALKQTDLELKFQVAFYDSNETFISMTSDWYTLSDMAIRPSNCKYIRIVLMYNAQTVFDPSMLQYCEISMPVEIDKYVITNTGVTHIELNDTTIVSVENGDTTNIVQFGQDLSVQDGVVNIADINRLILNVET